MPFTVAYKTRTLKNGESACKKPIRLNAVNACALTPSASETSFRTTDGARIVRVRKSTVVRVFRGSVRLNRCFSVRFVCTLSDSVSTGKAFSYSACAASLKPR